MTETDFHIIRGNDIMRNAELIKIASQIKKCKRYERGNEEFAST